MRRLEPGLLSLIAIALIVGWAPPISAEPDWSGPRRGSWTRAGEARPGDVILVTPDAPPPVIVTRSPSTITLTAAQFLADDLARLAGVKPRIVAEEPAAGVAVVLRVEPDDERREAYRIEIADDRIEITGADERGAAFGVYELCERIGMDPLHHWTGFEPEAVERLIVRAGSHRRDPPTFRFRGLFHDDEDILPRPLRETDNAPHPNGDVPLEWYMRFFETALRLRMNMVAPWVRTNRREEVVQLADEWGLYYTSHHYDTLLSDPYQFERGGLAEARGVEPDWNWVTNRQGLIRYWRFGVEENREYNAIYPVGMRGTNDYGYQFPEEWSGERKLKAYNEAFSIQATLVSSLLPRDRERLMHFTMYTEMLPFYQTGQLHVPRGVMIIWPDDNDGRMRGLPTEPGGYEHGVYYHLAYLGENISKQTHQIVPPERIEEQYRAIVESGATAFSLINVSELREYVLGTRMIADIMWDAEAAFDEPDAAGRFLIWWCREYFGADAADDTTPAYDAYFDLMSEPGMLGYGSSKVLGAIPSLRKKFNDESFAPALAETLPTLRERSERHAELAAFLEVVREAIPEGWRRRFFFENLELAAAIDRLPTESAILLVEAMSEPDESVARSMCFRALPPLDELDLRLDRAERSPFESWYTWSWIRPRNDKLHRPRRELIAFLRELEIGEP